MSSLFVDREVYLRADGAVRFVRVTRRAQLRAAVMGSLLLALTLGVTLVSLVTHAGAAVESAQLRRARAVVAQEQAAQLRYRAAAGATLQDLAERQRLMEALVTSRLGAPPAQPAPAATGGRRISAALPTAAQLHALEAQQDRFATALAARFDARTARTEAALRGLGLDPGRLLAAAREAQGGPLVPWPADGRALPLAIRLLAAAITRWTVLQDNLVAVPSFTPTDGTMVTSSYGVRADPFTGAAAFHAGLDFIGSYGQPIRAAAAGRVAYVGQRSGYGNVVEIDHGNGLLTRYAHLSGFDTAVGQQVSRGAQIARMGSTGRSTGTHLHFEVRVNGEAVNPRRFLEASQDFRDVQQTALARNPDPRHAGHRG
ncbi:M23 family metallopeptidase [Sphingomonas sp.]|uniref:M23 family metallopeptidase n=1 Tax=Sphingomonas sp. TaxID=28214 RepID=UPI003CC5225F